MTKDTRTFRTNEHLEELEQLTFNTFSATPPASRRFIEHQTRTIVCLGRDIRNQGNEIIVLRERQAELDDKLTKFKAELASVKQGMAS